MKHTLTKKVTIQEQSFEITVRLFHSVEKDKDFHKVTFLADKIVYIKDFYIESTKDIGHQLDIFSRQIDSDLFEHNELVSKTLEKLQALGYQIEKPTKRG